MRHKASRKAAAKDANPSLEPSHAEDDEEEHVESGEELGLLYKGAVNLPAHQTKHLAELEYRFPSLELQLCLKQRNDTNSTGSSLWLSSQVLSSYLIHTYATKPNTVSTSQKRVIELGSGTGLLSLLMARLGWNVVATDIPPVLDSVLQPNVEGGLYQMRNAGLTRNDQRLTVEELDWSVPPQDWVWDEQGPSTSASGTTSTTTVCHQHHTRPKFDLIMTADTIYEPSLIDPLFRTLSHLYHGNENGDDDDNNNSKAVASKQILPTVLLALERRDPTHIEIALGIARNKFGLNFRRIPVKRVRKIFDELGDGKSWSRDDWDGVEIWTL